MTGIDISTLPTLKIYLSDKHFTKEYIFETTAKFPPIDTPIGIVSQYCEHHNMSYIYQYTKYPLEPCFYHDK